MNYIDMLILNFSASDLTESDYWRALERLSRNDAVLRVALNDGSRDANIPDVKNAQKPIKTE